MSYLPDHVTETDESGPWNDCTWAAGLIAVQKATLGSVPGTRDEREALRRASGDLVGGSNLNDLSRGCQVRYGWPLPTFEGTMPGFRGALVNGGAVVQGLYALLPEWFQRWDRKFAAKGALSGHAAYVQDYRVDDDSVTWFDPLARGDDYKGERMRWAVLLSFMFGLSYVCVVQEGEHAPPVIPPEPDPTLQGDDALFNIAPATTHRDAVLKPGTVLYRDSRLTRRYSRVDEETPLGFLGSGKAFHAVVNTGNTNYVRRADVARIVPNERTYA